MVEITGPLGADCAELTAPDLRLAALPPGGHLLVQSWPGAPAIGATIAAVLGTPVPPAPNRAEGRDPGLLWVGPRQWVVLTAGPDQAAAWLPRLSQAMDGSGHAVDLSQGWQTLRVEGAGALDFLAEGCALDLEAAVPAGTASRTAFAKLPVLLHRIAADAFDLHVDRSLARHLWTWLAAGIRDRSALAALGI